MLQAFGVVISRSPQYDNMDAALRLQKQRMDKAGYDVFKKFMSQTVLFRGTHRFKAGDPLARLLEHMRTDGYNALPDDLKQEIRKSVYHPEVQDRRLDSDYIMRDEQGRQVGPVGFYANGVFSAVNWDQVSRLQQISAWESARACRGVSAWVNTRERKAARVARSFPPAAGRKWCRRYGAALEVVAEQDFLYPRGQLLYYAQAVDLVHQREFARDEDILRDALKLCNMSKQTANLMSFLPLHVGLRCKMTKKIMAPELVQECPCEVLRINFHPQERFGVPGCPTGLSQPSPNHPAWETGWLVLDYLPQSITLRIEESEEARVVSP